MSTPLDREGFGATRCDQCHKRTTQLVIDKRPYDRRGGEYRRYCWQCYWGFGLWTEGPIVNCGFAWDVIDVRRDTA
jgi:hypothetical protein